MLHVVPTPADAAPAIAGALRALSDSGLAGSVPGSPATNDKRGRP